MNRAASFVHNLFNKPLLISPAFEDALVRSAELLLKGGSFPPASLRLESSTQGAGRQSKEGVAVIPIHHYLSYRYNEVMDYFYGNTSYEQIRRGFQEALADPSVKAIVFDINSPGGEVDGLFDLVDEICSARGQKPIYAVFNESGFSAAFAIASAADKRYISRTGSSGSVGVVVMHLDQSGWNEKMGLVYTPIYAGARKVDFSPHAALSPEAMAVAQESVNAVYDLFVGTVSRNLSLTPSAVKATEAGIYQGKKAVEIGFADSVLSWNQFMTRISNRKYGGIMKAELEQIFNDMRDRLTALVGGTHPEVVTKADTEKLVATAEEAAKKEGFETGKAEGLEAGRQETQNRAIEILEACALAGMEKEALGYIQDAKLSVDNVRGKIVEAQAAAAERTRISSTVSATSTGEVNPLLVNARQRAETANAAAGKR
ncbi:signal peptide peptidase SppA [Syntrophus gentianae]|uniref:Signal peptide peptidase SppA n=1 Tax=Syntrophus gentianae TaxID=43775 RepID=A0A1H8B9V7_9BACT|nr:S49 family peptidase [Syntrophus gentianae]SEM78864.1 signal peptide peptidase SppA [Syntrophus gentianae]